MSLFPEVEYLTATIANGTSLSTAVALGSKTLVAIAMPAAWTPADLTFQASPDGGATFDELFTTDLAAADAVAAVQVHSPAAAQLIGIDPAKLHGAQVIKIRSGISGVPVNQGADRVLTLIVRGLL